MDIKYRSMASISEEISEHFKKFAGIRIDMEMEIYKKINTMKDSIGIAFMAETGLKASECEMVEEQTPTGAKWYFRRKKLVKEESMILIEKDIPIPRSNKGPTKISAEMYDALDKMEKNDSFLIDTHKELRRIRTYASRRKYKLFTRKENGKIRIWRLFPKE